MLLFVCFVMVCIGMFAFLSAVWAIWDILSTILFILAIFFMILFIGGVTCVGF